MAVYEFLMHMYSEKKQINFMITCGWLFHVKKIIKR